MIDVTCAIIEKEGKILAARRAHGQHLAGMWEFPGGKIEPGETAEECIVREIMEELNILIRICKKLEPVEYDYPEKSIRLIPFVCATDNDEVVLVDHSDFRWFGLDEIYEVVWAAADIMIIDQYLIHSKL
nr:8-oxo-dGTP diphosphatase MutT [Bacteroidota bacterium]